MIPKNILGNTQREWYITLLVASEMAITPQHKKHIEKQLSDLRTRARGKTKVDIQEMWEDEAKEPLVETPYQINTKNKNSYRDISTTDELDKWAKAVRKISR
jgi:hypothetical protein